MSMMEENFLNLEKIKKMIEKNPDQFQEKDFNIIFNMLEVNSYESVINKIRKNENIVPELNIVPDVPDSPIQNIRSPFPHGSLNETIVVASCSPQPHSRKRKRPPSEDFTVSPDREAVHAITEKVSRLREIFPDKEIEYLKAKIAQNSSLTVENLVTLVLDDNDNSGVVNGDDLNGHDESVQELHNNENNTSAVIRMPEVVVVSDDDELPSFIRQTSSSSRPLAKKSATGPATASEAVVLPVSSQNGHHPPPPTSQKPPESSNTATVVATQDIMSKSEKQQLRELGVVLDDSSIEEDEVVMQVPPENFKKADVTIDLDRGGGGDGDEGVNGQVDDGGGVLMDLEQQVPGTSNGVPEPVTAKDTNLSHLLNFFPHVDPSFLEKKATEIGSNDELQEFIAANVGSTSLPSRKDYDAKMAKKNQIDKIKNMTVGDFLREFENPEEHFNNTKSTVSDSYRNSCLSYLNSKFAGVAKKSFDRIVKKHNYHLLPSLKDLQKVKGRRKVPSNEEEAVITTENVDIVFFKDYIYLKLEPSIKKAIQDNEEWRRQKIEDARENGALFECQCCYDEECLLDEMCTCAAEKFHMFCRDCVRRGAEAQIGENKTRITCFQDCEGEIELRVLKNVLKPKIYEKLVERQANEDLMKANVENLVQCPACNFAVIIPESEKLIKCENSECGKVSCKECKEENHLPLKCEEVEKDDEIKARTKLENAMAEAMIRECPKCRNRFVKQDGCNKMKCKCGAVMCYLCKKLISNDYSHFYGHGATPGKNKCPLWSDNDNLHKDEVAKAAEATKKELGGDAANLKHDPTKGMEKPPEGYDRNKQHQHVHQAGVRHPQRPHWMQYIPVAAFHDQQAAHHHHMQQHVAAMAALAHHHPMNIIQQRRVGNNFHQQFVPPPRPAHQAAQPPQAAAAALAAAAAARGHQAAAGPQVVGGVAAAAPAAPQALPQVPVAAAAPPAAAVRIGGHGARLVAAGPPVQIQHQVQHPPQPQPQPQHQHHVGRHFNPFPPGNGMHPFHGGVPGYDAIHRNMPRIDQLGVIRDVLRNEDLFPQQAGGRHRRRRH